MPPFLGSLKVREEVASILHKSAGYLNSINIIKAQHIGASCNKVLYQIPINVIYVIIELIKMVHINEIQSGIIACVVMMMMMD